MPAEELKAAEAKIEKDEGLTDSLEGGKSSETSGVDLQSEPHTNGNMNHTPDDEITISPVEERFSPRDIRFGDLPHPRILEQENGEGTIL